MPQGRHSNGRRLADAVAAAHRYAPFLGVRNGREQLLLPRVGVDADDLLGKENGLILIAAHERQKRVFDRLVHKRLLILKTGRRGGAGHGGAWGGH